MGEKETATEAKKGEELGAGKERLAAGRDDAQAATVKGSKSTTSERTTVQDFEKNTEGAADTTGEGEGFGETARAGDTAMNAIRNMK